MHFNSLVFAAFFPLVYLVYWTLAARPLRLRNAFVLAASYLFYGWWDWRFLLLVAASSAVDFLVGLNLGRAQSARHRRLLLAVSLAANLGALGFFKYFNFFVDSARSALGALGLPLGLDTLDIILPVGISFYTFQTISYTVDVYRGALKPTRDPIAFFAFVSFFPQLVAGPIERAADLLPQFQTTRSFDAQRAADGLRQMLWGMVKKVLVADNLAGVVEAAYARPESHGGLALLVVTGLFFVQLYCDFSGYSDIAIGAARMLGFDLTRNFAFPFFSRTFTEFWQRWHITLNTWLRDYLFLEVEMRMHRRHLAWRRTFPKDQRPPRAPPPWRTAANMVVVFGLSGLWHGAAWTFVLWGLLNGLFLVPELVRRRPQPGGVAGAGRWLPSAREVGAMVWVNGWILLSLVLFRANTLGDAGLIYQRLFAAPLAFAPWPAILEGCLLASFPVVVEWFQRNRPHALAIEGAPRAVRWGCYMSLCLALLLHGSTASHEFVYFQF